MILFELRLVLSVAGFLYFFKYIGLIDSLLRLLGIQILRMTAFLDADIGDLTVSFSEGTITARKLRIFAPPDVKWKIDTIIYADTIICHLDILTMIYWLIQSNCYVICLKYVIVDGLKISVEAWEDPLTGEQHLNTSLVGLIPIDPSRVRDQKVSVSDSSLKGSDSLGSPTTVCTSASVSPGKQDEPNLKQVVQPATTQTTESSFSFSSYFSAKTASLFTDASEMWQDVSSESISKHFNKFSETLSNTASDFAAGCAQIAQNGTFLTLAQDRIQEAYATVKQSFGQSLRGKLEQFYESVSGAEPAPEDDDAHIYGRYIDLFNVEVQLRNALPVALRELEVKKGLRAAYFRIYLHELHHRVLPTPSSVRARRRSSAKFDSMSCSSSREDLTWTEVESSSGAHDNKDDDLASGRDSRLSSTGLDSKEDDTWRSVASPRPPMIPSHNIVSQCPLTQEASKETPTIVDWPRLMKQDAAEYELASDAWNGIHSKILSYRFEKALLLEVLKGNAGKFLYFVLLVFRFFFSLTNINCIL